MDVPLAQPERIGPHRVVEPLARGGMGAVYRCAPDDGGKPVAVKTVFDTDPHAARAIRREARLLARLRHPGVVRLLEDGEDEGRPWFSMPLLGPTSLRDWLDEWFGRQSARGLTSLRNAETAPGFSSSGGLSQERAPATLVDPSAHLDRGLGVVARLCQTLAWLHGEGVLHLDLKPSNILVTDVGRPVVVDFGITRSFAGARGREVIDGHASLAGTEDYMAPEQVKGGLVDARTDLYAVGCILFEILTGQPPFTRRGGEPVWQQHLHAEPPRPSRFAEHVAAPIDDLVLRLLEKDPHRRVGRASEVAEVLFAAGAARDPDLDARRPRPYLYRPPLSGRTHLLDEVDALCSTSADGGGTSILLAGASGSGKTRLALEIGKRAAKMGFTVVAGGCVPSESADTRAGGAPLQGFAPLFEEVVDRCREDPERRAAALGDRGPTLALVHRPIETLLDPGTRAPTWVGDEARSAIVGATVDTVYALADSGKPLALLIDDLQWADDLTLAAVKQLVRAIAQRPFRGFVVLTTRSDAPREILDAVGQGARRRRIDLEGLDRDALRGLVAGMLAQRDPPEGLVSLVAERAQGNPFDVAEVLHAAVDAGLLDVGAEGWTLTQGAVDESALPPGMTELVALRFQRLSERARSVLHMAAVMGRRTTLERLAALVDSPIFRIEDALEELVASRVLEEVGPGELQFLHDRVRERALTDLGAPDSKARRALHRRAADFFLRRGPLEAELGELTRHLRAAGDAEESLRYAVKAAAHAHRLGAHGEVIELLGSVIELEESSDLGALERSEALRYLGVALHQMGEEERALPMLHRAIVRAGTSLPSGLALLVRSVTELLRLVLVRGGTEAKPSPREVSQIAAFVEIIPSLIAGGRQGQFVAAALSAANLARRVGGVDGVRGYGFVGILAGFAGMKGAAATMFARSEALARASGSLRSLHHYAQFACFHWLQSGEFDKAEKTATEALEATLEAKASHLAEPHIYTLALRAVLVGDHRRAIELAEWLIDLCTASGNIQLNLAARMKIALCALDDDRPSDTVTLMDTATLLLEQDVPIMYRSNVFATRAVAFARLGELERARDDVTRVRATLGRAERRNPVLYNVNVFLPEVELHSAETASAPPDRAAAMERAKAELRVLAQHARSAAIVLPRLHWLTAQQAALVGNERRAAEHAALAAADAHRLGMAREETQAARPLRAMRTHAAGSEQAGSEQAGSEQAGSDN